MATYPTIRDVNNPIEVAGLKGQYILIAGVAVVCLFVIAVILSSTTISIWLVISIIGGSIYGVIRSLIYISNKLGVYGLMKMRVMYSLPHYIKSTRNVRDLIVIL